ncbi:hypothetical protein GCM10011352_30230 [Marinobacterium zhoushanense]|uniref:Helix-hairpin-helix DNA-binding motif class 1 domain-containing protein n=1 Tax=Marinobacterium zhoushanense TaxID=1679163 RepID=A0ABQ1KJP6_9GAMM|nr:helix-hairpin-helix domain-containing protein [Marinobacterium zhoushanense]GGC01992.1 hypothetical protein GCM10011352_30230 [Marinobacterium zhoushanense]
MNTPAIRFNGNVEYRIEGDTAQLGAELQIEDLQRIECQRLSLQLWACPDQVNPQALQGTRVAALALSQSLFTGFYQDQTLALPPAGDNDYTMALALVGETADGNIQVHDCAVFANRQLFLQPSIQGRVDCQLHDTSVSIRIDAIANRRDADNRSGALSLELWALNAPYQGGAFVGFPMASTELGTLDGQCAWQDCSFNLEINQPPVGEWAPALMLREWTPAGYITRDYRQLPSLVREAQMPMPAAVVNSQPTAEFIAYESSANDADQTPVEREHKADAEAAVVTEKEEVLKAPKTNSDAKRADKAEKKPATKAAKKKTDKIDEAVSINTASAKALSKVRGLSPRLAEAIIAERPYASLDELLKVRGIGARMLVKLRELLSL